ncbi:hypothetical protein SporoP37_00215 [Sporosarcina sp. P37]|uniref:hypothetical protein n=1 Tax=unclassified Sporosarcina TaxID=2647733 RepID=UPI000A179898|nr:MULTISPECIES: hypothetical protein [unclassified Sporosarcina]ARK23265.1 hypothetical protein SporoP37_00215 [Sporosarcina sp. P37]PID19515.1 hypothetical protein CSV62_03165 [Sporosarcina sp. P35]
MEKNFSEVQKSLIRKYAPATLKELKYASKKEVVAIIISEIKKYQFTVSEAKDLLDWAKEVIDSETVVKD